MELILLIDLLTSIVFPLPGGPNSSSPLAGALKPVNNSGRMEGRITISCKACFEVSCPAESIRRTQFLYHVLQVLEKSYRGKPCQTT